MNEKRQGNFINKLECILDVKFAIIQAQDFQEIVRWDESRTMIDILNLETMENIILPQFFRHKKYNSFVRQLNIYGFKKIKLNAGIRFTHDYLLQGRP